MKEYYTLWVGCWPLKESFDLNKITKEATIWRNRNYPVEIEVTKVEYC
mgnify:CR=1 FL=1